MKLHSKVLFGPAAVALLADDGHGGHGGRARQDRDNAVAPRTGPMILPYHYHHSGALPAPVRAVFDYLDDHAQLGNPRMRIDVDAGAGRQLGSVVRLSGRIFGTELSVKEIVIDREPPLVKVWETAGSPRLLIIGHYRMGFRICTHAGASELMVFIDYALPQSAFGRWLGRLLGHFYARWCARQMVERAQRHFAAAQERMSQSCSIG